MTLRSGTFRVAVRKFEPFESSMAKQWDSFDRRYHTALHLEAVPLDLNPLHESLFVEGGLQNGDWDAVMISTDWLAEALDSGGLLDLEPYLRESPPEGYPLAWSESLLRLQQFERRILGLPYHDGPECLIYRKDLFGNANNRERFAQQFGEELDVPRTWPQFRRVAQFLTCPQTPLYGTAFAAYPDGHNTVYDFCLQLWTRGGEVYDPSGRILLDSPQARESLDFYRQVLNDAGAVHPDSRTFDSVKSGLAFAAGRIAMMVNWFGFASMSETVAESKVKGCVAVAPVPSGAGPRASLNAYWILGIPAGSLHRDLTWKFVCHATNPEMDKLLTLEGGIGCRKSTWTDAQVNAAIPFYHCLEELHKEARELPRLRHWSELAAVIDEMVLGAINTQEPTEDIVRKAQVQADGLLVRGARTS